MREALANEIFRDRGVAAPRVAFYRIVVNTGTRDESWGLYTLVEDPADPAMLTSQFGGASGNLYKPDGPGADWTTFDRAGFEKKTNKATADFSDIQGGDRGASRERSPAAWRATLERHFDVDFFLRWLAVNQVVDNWDAYGRFAHNYYLYADPGKERPPRLDTLGQQLLLRPDPVRGESCRHGPAWRGACCPKVRWSAASRPSDRTTTCCSRTLEGVAADRQAPGGSRLHVGVIART
jgi:hypothetical protein